MYSSRAFECGHWEKKDKMAESDCLHIVRAATEQTYRFDVISFFFNKTREFHFFSPMNKK